jgi:hypothetical protein
VEDDHNYTANGEVLKAALAVIDPDINRLDWFALGCALFKEFGYEAGFKVWDEWSSNGEKYPGPQEMRKQWQSIAAKEGYGWTGGTIIHLADEADFGWRWRYDEELDARLRAAADSEETRQLIAELNAQEPQTVVPESMSELPVVDSGSIVASEQAKANDEAPQMNGGNVATESIESKDDEQPSIDETKRQPPTLSPDALYGLPGKVVRLFDPHTEADPAAILIQFLVSYGNTLNRVPHYQVEGDQHFTNLFALLVGKTGDGRKGVSAGRIRQLMKHVDPNWVDSCVQSGLSSGEGLIHAIRDEITKKTKEGDEVVEPGVEDKRIMLDEREFAQALTVMKRDGNTVSRIVRDAWDCRPVLTNLVKRSKETATNAMISVVGHITAEELKRMLDETSMFNAYANRFLFIYVKRSKYLPFGGDLKEDDIRALAQEVNEAWKFAHRSEEVCVLWPYALTLDEEARELWASVYPRLVTRPPGLLGAICGRAEAQVIRLALVYAATDKSNQIKRVHLQAALALWQYSEDSARFIFGDSLGDPVADELLQALRTSGGMTRTGIRDYFARNQNREKVGPALEALKNCGMVKCEPKKTGGRGRPEEFWTATKPVRRATMLTKQADMPRKDLTGQRFGRLVAKTWAGHDPRYPCNPYAGQWICLCDCGNYKVVLESALKRGTRSCGCLAREGLAKASVERSIALAKARAAKALEECKLLAGDLLRVLQDSGGMNRTQIRDHLKRDQSREEIDAALTLLEQEGKARRERRLPKGGRRGRPVEWWVAVN